MRTLTGHTGYVFSVAFSRDGNRVVSGSQDHHVKIWDTETGGEVSSFVGVEQPWSVHLVERCLGLGFQKGKPRCQALTRSESLVVRRCAR